MTYVLDTTVIVDHVRGYPPGVEVLARLFEESGDLLVCDVVTCEALSRGDADEQQDVRSLLDALEYVAIDPEGARWAGDRRREGTESGAGKPSVCDTLIAAVAWRLGATVVTRNARDFAAFGVPVLDYGTPLP
jgi:predicted nucleic acid-binding protein